MEDAYAFAPSRRQGSVFLGVLLLVLLAFNLWNVLQIAFSPLNLGILIHLGLVFIAPLPIPWLFYRLRALQSAEYLLGRDGIRLRWGMRLEDIPMRRVLWVRRQAEDAAALILPRLRLPGAVLGNGKRRLPDGSMAEVPLEFMASRGRDLVLLATPARVFAISPADVEAFLLAFEEVIQYGSLNLIPAQSVYPSFWSRRALQSRKMRSLLILGAGLNLLLFGAAAYATSTFQVIRLHAMVNTRTPEALPGMVLWLLPFVNLILFAVEWAGGFFLYREEQRRPLAYLLWGSGIFSTLLFLVALYYILQTAQ